MNDRTLNDSDVEAIANKFVERLVATAKDAKTVEEITDVWGAHFDRHLGKTVRRGMYLVAIAVFAFIGIKLDAFAAFFSK